MGRLLLRITLGIVVATACLASEADGQVSPSQSVASDSPSATPSIEAVQPATESDAVEKVQPVAESSDATVDPASLLPDLPKLPPAKASLIGGTIGRLDRVRDQITVQVFGGGKMKISFDPRTRVYHDHAEASLADLREGDRVYIDTILDGSAVFARAIRLKTSAAAGESQGIVTSYRADKGELQINDALSPSTVKIRVTPQTQIVVGDHSASAGRLAPGTMVAIKFGPRQDGDEVAREISVLASPGQTFTFVGQVTAIDLRLGLLALTSSVDHKTYEIYLDPSVSGVDDNLRPSAEVTVLTRFQNNRYEARSVTVNSQN